MTVRSQYVMDWSDSSNEYLSIDVLESSGPRERLFGAGVFRDKDFNILKRDYMVMFKITSFTDYPYGTIGIRREICS
jgi:hypothetical protein